MRYIYKILFPNEKVYIGQTKNIKQRMSSYKTLHCKDMPKLFNALKKYKFENCIFEILITCNDNNADELERKYIKEYKSLNGNFGYNIQSGGCKGKILSEETKRKISVSEKKYFMENPEAKERCKTNLGKKHSKETLQKIIKANTGQKRCPHSKEHKEKISKSLKGIVRSIETREKISKAKFGILRSDETKKKISNTLKNNYRNKKN